MSLIESSENEDLMTIASDKKWYRLKLMQYVTPLLLVAPLLFIGYRRKNSKAQKCTAIEDN